MYNGMHQCWHCKKHTRWCTMERIHPGIAKCKHSVPCLSPAQHGNSDLCQGPHFCKSCVGPLTTTFWRVLMGYIMSDMKPQLHKSRLTTHTHICGCQSAITKMTWKRHFAIIGKWWDFSIGFPQPTSLSCDWLFFQGPPSSLACERVPYVFHYPSSLNHKDKHLSWPPFT